MCLNSIGVCLFGIHSQIKVEEFCSSSRKLEEHDHGAQGCLILFEGGKNVFYTIFCFCLSSWRVFYFFNLRAVFG